MAKIWIEKAYKNHYEAVVDTTGGYELTVECVGFDKPEWMTERMAQLKAELVDPVINEWEAASHEAKFKLNYDGKSPAWRIEKLAGELVKMLEGK